MRGRLNARTAGLRFRVRRAVALKGSARTDAAKRTGKSFPLPKAALRYRTGRPKRKVASQEADLSGEFKPENPSQKTNLHFERVNEVTFKLTDGESTNVPASHGQWGGYRTTKAVAWVIKIGSDAWLARRGGEACGPSFFNEKQTHSRWREALMAITS